MGFTQKLGLLAQGVYSDSSLNVGIGGAPSGSYKFETTGTAKISSTLLVSGVVTFGSTLSNGTYTYTLPSATGTLALTSDIHSAVTLSAIGSTANANGATLTGQVLNLQPADASFGGVVTTGTQTFAGAKTFSSQLTLSSTLSNGTYTYTLPSATGTLALTSALSSYLPLTGGTLTGALVGTSVTLSGNVIFDTTDRGIVSNTTDGADNKFVSINGGGARGSDRGAGINLFGNEAAGTGRIDVNAGDVTGGVINLVTAGLNRLTVARDGNVGIGVTPSAWYNSNNYVALQVGNASLFGRNSANSELYLSSNVFDNSSGTPTYITTDFAARYVQNDGVHSWLTAPSGTAGNPITFTTALTIASTGAATFSSSVTATGLTVSLSSGTIARFSSAIAALGTTSIGLGYTDGSGGHDMAQIFGQRINDGSGRSSLILAVNAVDNDQSATVSDAKITISGSTGNITLASALTGTSATFSGAVSKGSGSFRIEHPLPSLSETHQLVHSFIEGPQADLIYRGKLTLVNGKAQANIDKVSTMTEGTFEALCRDIQCFTTNESGWDLIKGKVIGNIIYIESQNENSTDEISWMVIGERKDKHMMETEWTDENGKVIVEPLKPIEPEPMEDLTEVIEPIVEVTAQVDAESEPKTEPIEPDNNLE